MIDQLPAEVVHKIASHLPSASSIIQFSLTNRRLHALISADGFAIFRSFVKENFPTIRTPPYWKEAASILTTRSRAWDRRAFIAKALRPPVERLNSTHRTARSSSVGYTPVIDSYEIWHGSRWVDKHEVLVWGAAGRLVMRINDRDSTTWHTHRARNDHLPQEDILNIRLLRPNQRRDQTGEEVIVRRANGKISKLELDLRNNKILEPTVFDTLGVAAECMDVSHGSKPLVAVCNPKSIQVFDGVASEPLVRPVSKINFPQNLAYKHRKRCATFLDDKNFAIGFQYVEGRAVAPIHIYRIGPDGSDSFSEQCMPSRSGDTSVGNRNRTNANTIVPLDDVLSLSGRGGEVFLSGWSDGLVRLFDVRAPCRSSADFQDDVDDGQILSLLPIGHERFLAGSVQNACLKTFDLRMPGAKVYSYREARSSLQAVSNVNHARYYDKMIHSRPQGPVKEANSRQLNILLAIRIQQPTRLWQPLPEQHINHLPRYRGAVYALSAPSPASPTVYAGVENQIIQLDFVSTDDLQLGRQNLSAFGLDPDKGGREQILSLHCYERPRMGHESTDTVLLRNQVDGNRSRLEDGLTEDGWDERWRLASWDRRSSSWRAQNI